MIHQSTMPSLLKKSVIDTQVDVSPFIIEFFMVQGLGFRCMAYRDQDGKWYNALNRSELFGDIQILE